MLNGGATKTEVDFDASASDERARAFLFLVLEAERSGETPSTVLGASTGTLVVYTYTGYNEVTSTGGRTRAACLAHARLHLFDARPYAPDARVAVELIRESIRRGRRQGRRYRPHRRAHAQSAWPWTSSPWRRAAGAD
jgi:hypothetical protein